MKLLAYFFTSLILCSPIFGRATTPCGLNEKQSSLKKIEQTVMSWLPVQCAQQEIIDPLLDPYKIQSIAMDLCSKDLQCMDFLRSRVAQISGKSIANYKSFSSVQLWGEMLKFSGFNRIPPVDISELPLKTQPEKIFNSVKNMRLAERELNKDESAVMACTVVAAIVGPAGKAKAAKSAFSFDDLSVVKWLGNLDGKKLSAILTEVGDKLPDLKGKLDDLASNPSFKNNEPLWNNIKELADAGKLSAATLQNLTVKHGENASRMISNLSNLNKSKVEQVLADTGFKMKSETTGGYTQWTHPDGSVVWIRTNGEIVRLSPELKTPNGKVFRARYDQDGLVTENHNTGEIIKISQ